MVDDSAFIFDFSKIGDDSFFGIVFGEGEGISCTFEEAIAVGVKKTSTTDSLVIFSSAQETKKIQKIQNIIFIFFIRFFNLFR